MDSLIAKWGIPGHVDFAKGNGGLTKVVLSLQDGPSAELYLHGSHVTSFKTAAGREIIFMSSKSAFDLNKAIRGGIPVIFPQFGPGPLPQHGFARNSNSWTVEDTSFSSEAGTVSILLQLKETPETLQVWDCPFCLQLRTSISVKNGLSVFSQSFDVKNTGDKPFSFTSALHTYFNIPNIHETTVAPLNVPYLDKIKAVEVEDPLPTSVTLTGPTDRVYHNAADKVVITTKGTDVVELHKQKFNDLVVWNCWEAASKSMADMGDEDWKTYICCESGAISKPVELSPGETWHGEHSFHAKL